MPIFEQPKSKATPPQKTEEPKPSLSVVGLAATAYAAYVAEPENANMETQQFARVNFTQGFERGYAAAKGK